MKRKSLFSQLLKTVVGFASLSSRYLWTNKIIANSQKLMQQKSKMILRLLWKQSLTLNKRKNLKMRKSQGKNEKWFRCLEFSTAQEQTHHFRPCADTLLITDAPIYNFLQNDKEPLKNNIVFLIIDKIIKTFHIFWFELICDLSLKTYI